MQGKYTIGCNLIGFCLVYCTSHNFKITTVNVGNVVQVQGYCWVLERDFAVQGSWFLFENNPTFKIESLWEK